MEDMWLFVSELHPDKFDELAADHAKWRSVAGHLLASAGLLWPHIEQGFAEFQADPKASGAGEEGLRHRGPFYLLAGMSIENMLKALIVLDHEKQDKKVSNGATLTFINGRHDLVRLCEQANVSLDGYQAYILERFSMYVTWGGRYPIPKRKADIEHKVSASNDMDEFRNFMSRLEQLYRERLAA